MSNENTKQEIAQNQETNTNQGESQMSEENKKYKLPTEIIHINRGNTIEYGPLSSEEFTSQKIDLGLRITVKEVLDHFGLEPEDLEGDHIIEYLSECILNDARIESFHPWDEDRDECEVEVGDALSLEF